MARDYDWSSPMNPAPVPERMATMDCMTISREKMLMALRKNRNEHIEDYMEAKRVFAEKVMPLLKACIKDAEDGEVHLSQLRDMAEPVSFAKEYDRAIQMLEFSADEFIQVTSHDFRRYVMDEWEWKQDWAMNTLAYTSKGGR